MDIEIEVENDIQGLESVPANAERAFLDQSGGVHMPVYLQNDSDGEWVWANVNAHGVSVMPSVTSLWIQAGWKEVKVSLRVTGLQKGTT